MTTGPGIRPVEYRVLVRPDETERKSAGGIIIPDAPADRQEHAQTRGTLVAKGALAFEDWGADALDEGARVIFAKFAGVVIKGADGHEYRLITDKDISARIEA